jgi:radical SAM superfamily enzyme YgiQ (UPF0313 family)
MTGERSTFHLVLIRPSHYDDEGYVIQWRRSVVPSNSLAALYGLAVDCAERKVLGEEVEITVEAYDETNTRIQPHKIAKMMRKAGTRGLVGLVGVQSNQYPRALDLARQFRSLGIQVCLGGFHVSGCLAMLPGIQSDLQEAIDLGVSLYAGESEHRFDEVLQDAYRGTMKSMYNYLQDPPELVGAPVPSLPANVTRLIAMKEATFDAGRGCPFKCSFCTIINVQGHKSRSRSADDIEHLVRRNHTRGIRHYFITDDNFSRNRDWEEILDRLIRLREEEGIDLRIIIQVDAMSHKVPGFIEKAVRAGVNKVFIGLESVHPDSLEGVGKKQNRIVEYRRMLLEWRRAGAVTLVHYILGFPKDTPQSILGDIEILQRELPIDFIQFNNLTPLPGSEDHKRLHDTGEWMEPDLNRYDLNHITTEHPRMSRQEWEEVYRLAWRRYYSPEHIRTMLYRARATGLSTGRIARMVLGFYGSFNIEGLPALEGGFIRLRYRRDRRPTLPIESPFIFYPRVVGEFLSKLVRYTALARRVKRVLREVEKDPAGDRYIDASLTLADTDEVEHRLNAAPASVS